MVCPPSRDRSEGSIPSFLQGAPTLLRAGIACQPSGVPQAPALRSTYTQSPWLTSREWPTAAIAPGIAVAIVAERWLGKRRPSVASLLRIHVVPVPGVSP